MSMVVTEPSKGCKDKSCLTVCPCECFYENADMVYINPEEFIECEACIPKCPVEAIFHEDNVPAQWVNYFELNAKRSNECPPAKSL